jgi:hypothetical protein
MKVQLSSIGNPDFNQNPNMTLFGCEPNKSVEVKTFKEASDVCTKFINDNDLGSGNWDGGQIFDGKKQVAYVSYNGRVWQGQEGVGQRVEIKI